MTTSTVIDTQWYFYKAASSGNIYPIQMDTALVGTSEIPSYKEDTTQLCMQGCKLFGFGGGCPPLSPDFDNLKKTYPLMYVFYLMFHSEFMPPRLRSEKKVWYRPVRFQDVLLSKLLYRIGYNVRTRVNKAMFSEDAFKPCKHCVGGVCIHRGSAVTCGGGAMFLSNGHCEGCIGAERCAFKEGSTECRHPDRRMFSMESTGLRVDHLMKHVFDIDTHWYTTAQPTAPYMVKTAALLLPLHKGDSLTDNTMRLYKAGVDSIFKRYLKEEKSYTDLSPTEKDQALNGEFIHDVSKD